ncbi:MAG: hypothetical protein ACI83W_000120 [Marinoscillum sp.]|jgi:hypothetical protein
MRRCAESAFMKEWTKSLFRLILVFTLGTIQAQNIPMESWRTHFSYREVKAMTQGNGKIFIACTNGLFYVTQSDGAINTLTKTDGLSDAGISALHYDEESKSLIIGYESGLIDIHQSGKVKTIRDLINTALIGSKRVNHITSYENRAYLSTSFGIIVVSLIRNEITDNYRSIGMEGKDVTVKETAIFNNHLFAVTSEGVQRGSLIENLLDFNNWIQVNNVENVRKLTAGDKLYAVLNDTSAISILDNGFENIILGNNEEIIGLVYENDLKLLFSDRITDAELNILVNLPNSIVASSFLFSDGFWVGTTDAGLYMPAKLNIFPQGPLSDHITNISFTNNKLYTLYGPSPSLYDGSVDSMGYSQFDNNSWTSNIINGFYNISDVKFFNGRNFFSSAGFGLYDELLKDTVAGLSENIQGGLPIIPSLALHESQLYFPSYLNQNVLYSLDINGILNSISSSSLGTQRPVAIKISQYDVAWIQRDGFEGGGFVAIDLNDQNSRRITGADGLPSSQISDMVIDLDDEAWVATASGPAVFSNASFIFNNDDAITPIFDNQLLFENEYIYSVAVDGGNRIWMSTESGLFIFDNTLSKLDEHFDTENSPLPSNIVNKMAYNAQTGEMYLLSTKGLVSYRSASSQGSMSNTAVSIYPNPVRQGYDGKVGISGMTQNANVKITNIQGKLIRSLKANGGSLAWDLRDYNGHNVTDGVYFILVANAAGDDTIVGKIAVIR